MLYVLTCLPDLYPDLFRLGFENHEGGGKLQQQKWSNLDQPDLYPGTCS